LVRITASQSVAGNAGVVDQDVEATEVGVDLAQGGLEHGQVGDVDLVRASIGEVGGDLLARGGIDFQDGDGRAVSGEAASDGLAQAATGAGDDGDAASQWVHMET
jgi:hypothetical protein